jgi:hypothetical protein
MSERNARTQKSGGRTILADLDDSLYVVAAYLVRYLTSLRRVEKKLAQ